MSPEDALGERALGLGHFFAARIDATGRVDGDKSPAKSGDKSPHSKGRMVVARVTKCPVMGQWA